jgi:hypothetical protein
MIQKRDKASNGPLEVDVVLPERIVGVDEEGLGRQAFASSLWALVLRSGLWLLAFGLKHGIPPG